MANQKQELPVAAMLGNGSKQNVNGWQTSDTKWWQKLILPLARWAKKNIKMWIPTGNV